MSNIAGKAYAMNVLTPVPVHGTWINHLIFRASRAFPYLLNALMSLKLIHFARWVFIRRDQWPDKGQGPQKLKYDYMLFCSNFNGTWDQYVDAFSDGIPGGLDSFWYSSLKYPHSIPITPFKDYITHNQFDTAYYYNATPGAALRDIKGALAVKAALLRLAAVHATGDEKRFAGEYRKELANVQNCLSSSGFAPIASLDTWIADIHRMPFIEGDAATR